MCIPDKSNGPDSSEDGQADDTQSSIFADPELIVVRDRVQKALEEVGGKLKLGFITLHAGGKEIAVPVPDLLLNTLAQQQRVILDLHRQMIMTGSVVKAVVATLDEETLAQVVKQTTKLAEKSAVDLEKVAAEVKKPSIAIANGRILGPNRGNLPGM